MNKRNFTTICLLAITAMTVWAQEVTFRPLQYEILPDMATPRRGHACFATAKGDIVVVGGHTTGFSLTTSAERLYDGQWNSLDISYPHDGAANVTLPDGRVLICGGMGSGYGIGQSSACEIYDPETYTFTTTGSLNTPRAFCSGVAIGEGNKVLLSGNWYNSDTTFELWNGSSWTAFGDKSPELNNPFMVSADDGSVYVFGCRTNYGSLVPVVVWKVDTDIQTVETLTDTGLEEYELIHGDYFTVQSVDGGYLLLGKKDNDIHLLYFITFTAQVIDLGVLPDTAPDAVSAIEYVPGILVNPSRNEAYIVGGYQSTEGRSLLVINFSLKTGKMTAYFGGPFEGYLHWGAWALQPTTDKIVFTGGAVSDNFDAVATTIVVTPFVEENALCPDDHHPHMIDLGLSVKWACCNVGATKPEDFGNYFAWGETEERDNEYVKENYVYANEDIGSCISGTEYDVATKKWGSAYMMPTKADAEELIENCTLEPTVLNGVVGFRFIAANGNSIFMPIAGFHWLYGRDSYVGVYGNYWTGDKYEDDINGYRLYLECQEASAILNASFRYNGQNVRPVSYHTTGIVAIDDSNKTYGHYYTLDGRQVEKANYSGLYIRNGKKVLIR